MAVRKARSGGRCATSGPSSAPMACALAMWASVVLVAARRRNATTGWSAARSGAAATSWSRRSLSVVASFSSLSGRGKSAPLSQFVTDWADTPTAAAKSFCDHPLP